VRCVAMVYTCPEKQRLPVLLPTGGAGLHRKGASHNSDAVWAVRSFARHAGVGEAAIHGPQKTLDRPERVAANR
jgi:hypothetical protein